MNTNELNEKLPPPITNVDDLIGLEFKRNKYGLSQWTDKITYVGYTSRVIDRKTRNIEMFVIGTLTTQWYYINEIVIVNKKLHWIEEAQLDKVEFHRKLRSGEIRFRKIDKKTDESN